MVGDELCCDWNCVLVGNLWLGGFLGFEKMLIDDVCLWFWVKFFIFVLLFCLGEDIIFFLKVYIFVVEFVDVELYVELDEFDELDELEYKDDVDCCLKIFCWCFLYLR